MMEGRIDWLKNKLFFDFFESTKDDGMRLSLMIIGSPMQVSCRFLNGV